MDTLYGSRARILEQCSPPGQGPRVSGSWGLPCSFHTFLGSVIHAMMEIRGSHIQHELFLIGTAFEQLKETLIVLPAGPVSNTHGMFWGGLLDLLHTCRGQSIPSLRQ
jgi:hypothetical protein